MNQVCLLIFILGICLPCRALAGQALPDVRLSQINFDQKINSRVSPDLIFTDDHDQTVRIGNYFDGRPTVLILGYYGCPMLCTLVLNGATECFRNLVWQAGNEFNVVFVSIDPQETVALARAKKASYEHAYGNVHADTWHFLIGNSGSISNLASEIGFRYAYDDTVKQFAHPSGFVILTPDGRVSNYFCGINFAAKDVDAAMRSAAIGKTDTLSSPNQFSLLCFHYAPVHGRYGNWVMLIVRISGVTMLIALAVIFFSQFVRPKKGR